jgi:ABC-type sulfate transport system permease component
MTAISRRVLPGFSLSLGYCVCYLSLLVLIPLAACFLKAASLAAANAVLGLLVASVLTLWAW